MKLRTANRFGRPDLLSLMLSFVIASIAGAKPQKSALNDASREIPQTTVDDLEDNNRWKNRTLLGFPEPPPPYQVERVFESLEFRQLITLGRIPKTKRILAVEHERAYAGPSRVWQFSSEEDLHEQEQEKSLFLECPEIIYGFAFDPEFQKNRLLYVGCNGHSEKMQTITTKVLRFRVEISNPPKCDPESRKLILEWKSNGHNGGDLVFDNAGMLFVSAGDGTSDSDRNHAGQDLSTLNGSLLRIDVRNQLADSSETYRIPSDNPNWRKGKSPNAPDPRSEIWAFGLRNPWRIAFDAKLDQLWIGNNGQDLWESVYLAQKGANYGWSIQESNHPFHQDQPIGPAPISSATVEHHHSEARSLTGGPVYRGAKFPELQGAFVYGDFATGNIWAIRHDNQRIVWKQHLARTSLQITDFIEDANGDLLIADHAGGIYRLTSRKPNARTVPRFPRLLSETGLFRDTAQEIPASGVFPYRVNSPLWSDGAIKRRWIALPSDGSLGFKKRGSYDFPDKSVTIKSFGFPDAANGAAVRRVETRIMVKLSGEWFGYSYRWNSEQTDAELVDAPGMDEVLDWTTPVDTQEQPIRWRYPSRTECMVCHSRAANFALGVSTEQLHRLAPNEATEDALYANKDSHGGHPTSDVLHFEELGLFGASFDPAQLSSASLLTNPTDPHSDLDSRVRSYLHVNCSSCHVKEGGGNSQINLSAFVPREKMNLFGRRPMHELTDATEHEMRLALPGQPQHSVLLQRVSRRGPGQMPPLASNVVDPQAVELIRAWLEN